MSAEDRSFQKESSKFVFRILEQIRIRFQQSCDFNLNCIDLECEDSKDGIGGL